jgi:hypothetical protein
MTDMESCAICIEPYNGRRVKVTCQYCPSNACRGCQQTYLTQTFQDPHCMECKRGWSAEFIAANFPLSFRNDTLRKWRRRILVEREKAMLPMMQEYVGYKKEMIKYAAEAAAIVPDHIRANEEQRKAGDAYYAALGLCNAERARMADHKKKKEEGDTSVLPEYQASKILWKGLRQKTDAALATYKKARETFTAVHNKLLVAQTEKADAEALYEGRKKSERREFVMKCPEEGCRGFLSSAYKCGTCEKFTCAHCLEVLGATKDDNHVCNKDTVETAKTIKSETRPCPKCGTRIFKIDGCNQMWCTMDGCDTAFDWVTGKVETGRNHNPHYYEWLRRTGGGVARREPGDMVCGGMPGAWELDRFFYVLSTRENIGADIRSALMESHRGIQDIALYRMRDYQIQTGPLTNKDLDVQYLMQELDAMEWQRQLEFTEARIRRKQEIGSILQMATAAATDIYRRVLLELPNFTSTRAAFDWIQTVPLIELEQLREFANGSLLDLAKRQKQAVPQIGPFWKWEPLRALYKAAKESAGAAAGGST